MLKAVTKAYNLLFPVIHINYAGFCSSKYQIQSDLSFMEKEFFTPFQKEETLKAVQILQEHFQNQNMLDSNNHIILDVLSETPYSKTNRIFDRHHKEFFAQKTIALNSFNSWNQTNLILKQTVRRSSEIDQIISLNFNEKSKEVTFFNLLQKRTLGDFLEYRKKNQLTWTDQELKIITWQLIHQASALRNLYSTSDLIGYKKMFIDEKTNLLKLYDLSDFTDISNKFHCLLGGRPKININTIIYSLVKIINPDAPVHNSEEAQVYLKTYHPTFLLELDNIQEILIDFDAKGKYEIQNNISKQIPSFLSYKAYDKFLSEKLIQILQTQKLPNLIEDTGYLYQGLGLYKEALEIFENPDYKAIPSQKYLNIAEIHRSMSNFDKAQEYFDKALEAAQTSPSVDYFMIAKIQNEYGKLFSCKGQFEQAMIKFQVTEQNLKLMKNPSRELMNEIQKNIELTKSNQISSQDTILDPIMKNQGIEKHKKKFFGKILKWVKILNKNPFLAISLLGFVYTLFKIIKDKIDKDNKDRTNNSFKSKFNSSFDDDDSQNNETEDSPSEDTREKASRIAGKIVKVSFYVFAAIGVIGGGLVYLVIWYLNAYF